MFGVVVGDSGCPSVVSCVRSMLSVVVVFCFCIALACRLPLCSAFLKSSSLCLGVLCCGWLSLYLAVCDRVRSPLRVATLLVFVLFVLVVFVVFVLVVCLGCCAVIFVVLLFFVLFLPDVFVLFVLFVVFGCCAFVFVVLFLVALGCVCFVLL